MGVHGRNHHVICVIKLIELCTLKFLEPTVMDGLTGWDVIQPSENFFLEKPAALKLNVGNILENGDISFLQMAGKLIPKYVVSHHRQQYCSCTRTAYSGYDWKPLTQPYLV